MADPVMATVATALVAWATTAVADQARAATAAVVAFVRERFASYTRKRDVVDAALDGAGGRSAIDRLAGLLEQESSRDPEFGRRLRLLWDRAENAIGDTGARHINQITGNVSGSVVQARDVQGGISFGTTHRPPSFR